MMPRLTHITLALATLFATAAVVSAQSAYPAGQGTTNEALQYQNQNGQKASPYDYDGGTQNTQGTTIQGSQQYSDDSQYAQQAPAYNQQYPQQQAAVPPVDSAIEYPAPAVASYPYPYPYYGYPYGYYPYGGGIHIGLGFGYYGGYRGYYPYRGGYYGGYRGFSGYHAPLGGGFRGGIGFHGGGGFRGGRR